MSGGATSSSLGSWASPPPTLTNGPQRRVRATIRLRCPPFRGSPTSFSGLQRSQHYGKGDGLRASHHLKPTQPRNRAISITAALLLPKALYRVDALLILYFSNRRSTVQCFAAVLLVGNQSIVS